MLDPDEIATTYLNLVYQQVPYGHGQERFETWEESDSHVVPHATMVVILYIANSFEATKDGLSKEGAK
jgi:hypothetical protein